MAISNSFRGASGKAHSFERVDIDGAWARVPGIAIFAAPDSYGWRVIRVVELTGRPHDVRPLWALSDAERYGANAVFVALELDAGTRKTIVADIEMGLNPVCSASRTVVKLAA